MPKVAPERLTQDELNLLRSWLAGNDIANIAKVRRQTRSELTEQLVSLCDLNREHAHEILRTGVRRTPGRRNAPPAVADVEPTAPVDPGPVPYAEYDAWRCRWCRYIGPADQHRPLPGRACIGEPDLEPVTVAILPRSVSEASHD